MSSERIDLLWYDNSPNESGFSVERRLGASGEWLEVATTVDAHLSDTGLAENTAYDYRVRALSDEGPSLYSNVASGTTPITGPPSIRADHPRLWITPNDLGTLQARTQGSHATDWSELLAKDRGPVEDAFAYLVTGEASYAQSAIADAHSLAAAIRVETNDMTLRAQLFSMTYVFDWCYPALSAADKQLIGNAMLYGLRWQVDEGYNEPDTTFFGGGHHHGHQAVALQASMALLGETFPLDEDYGHSIQEFFEFTYDHFEHGWWPIMRRIGLEGGGWYMSWMYTAGHLGRHILMLAALRSGSGYDYFTWESWARHIPEFSIYGIDSAEVMSPIITGDQGWPRFRADDYVTNIILGGAYADPEAVWFVERMREAFSYIRDDTPGGNMHRILWHDYGIEPSAIADLPRARAFDGVGKYVIREGWDPNDLWLYVKNMSFFVWNHNHRANGHFALTYKGGHLAIDGGFYDSYGSDHHVNYATRAIAHNTVLIDGNQSEYRWNTNPYETSIAKTSVFEHTDSYGAIVADYTDSCATVDYDTQTVAVQKTEEMVRHIAYLRQVSGWECPVVVIYDRAVATDPSYEKRWLLHTVNAPELDGLTTTITEGDAQLFVQTLDSSQSSFSVTRRGSDADIFDGSHFEDWSYQGWPADCDDAEHRKDYYYPGRWRLEVIPTAQQAADHFVHVLAPASLAVASPPDTALVEAALVIGARVANRVVVWGKSAATLPELEYSVDGQGSQLHLVGNLVPNRRHQVWVGNDLVAEATSSRNGLLEFSCDPTTSPTTYRVVELP